MGGVLVPTYVGGAASWSVVDWFEVQKTSPPAAGGLATIVFDQLPSDERWLIDRIVCYSDSTSTTSLRVYRSGVSPQTLRSGSRSGNFDEADYPTGLLLFEASSLVAQWTGASDGATGVLAVQGRRLVRA